MEPTLITQTQEKSRVVRGPSFITPSLGSSVCLFHWAAPNNPLSQLPQPRQGKAKGHLKRSIQWLWEGSGTGKLIFPGDKAKSLSLRAAAPLQVGNSSMGRQGGDEQILLLIPCVPCPRIEPQGGGSWRTIRYGPKVQRCS